MKKIIFNDIKALAFGGIVVILRQEYICVDEDEYLLYIIEENGKKIGISKSISTQVALIKNKDNEIINEVIPEAPQEIKDQENEPYWEYEEII